MKKLVIKNYKKVSASGEIYIMVTLTHGDDDKRENKKIGPFSTGELDAVAECCETCRAMKEAEFGFDDRLYYWIPGFTKWFTDTELEDIATDYASEEDFGDYYGKPLLEEVNPDKRAVNIGHDIFCEGAHPCLTNYTVVYKENGKTYDCEIKEE